MRLINIKRKVKILIDNPRVYLKDGPEYGYIYAIINDKNKKIYIGQTKNCPEARVKDHFKRLRCQSHGNEYLQRAYNKYGVKKFSYIVLEKVKFKKQIDDLESKWIAKYNALNHEFGYNLRDGGPKGKPHPKTIAKLKLHSPTAYTIAKAREYNLGRKLPKSTTRKMRIGMNKFWADKSRSGEYRERLRKQTGIKSPNWMSHISTDLIVDLKYNQLLSHAEIIKYFRENLNIKITKAIIINRVRAEKKINPKIAAIKMVVPLSYRKKHAEIFKGRKYTLDEIRKNPNYKDIDVNYLHKLRYIDKMEWLDMPEFFKKNHGIIIQAQTIRKKLKKAGLYNEPNHHSLRLIDSNLLFQLRYIRKLSYNDMIKVLKTDYNISICAGIIINKLKRAGLFQYHKTDESYMNKIRALDANIISDLKYKQKLTYTQVTQILRETHGVWPSHMTMRRKLKEAGLYKSRY